MVETCAMAKVELNSALSSLSGRMDSWVYRRTRGGTSVGRRPVFTTAPTASQVAVREKFRLAAAYAKSALLDPALRSRYETAARGRRLTVFPFVVADLPDAAGRRCHRRQRLSWSRGRSDQSGSLR